MRKPEGVLCRIVCGRALRYRRVMSPLARLLFGVIASTLASVAVVAALVSGVTGLWALLACAVVGGIVALPISIFVARKMTG